MWSRTTAAVLAAGALLTAADAAHAGSIPAPERAIEMLNEWRASVGVPPVAFDPAHSDDCRKHAEYYRLNHTSGHAEDPSRPGYSAEGHRAAASSVLSYGGDFTDGPYVWEDAVYHRTGLLNPRLVRAGYWAEQGIACLGVFGVDSSRTQETVSSYPYPFDGQVDVPIDFSCNETPNPCESVPGNSGRDRIGFIPSVQFAGPWRGKADPVVLAASLTPDEGAPVPLTVEDSTSARAPYLDGGLALLPHEPLRRDTWYTAHVTGTLPAQQSSSGGYYDPFAMSETRVPFDVAWRFRTAPGPWVPLPATTAAELRLRLSRTQKGDMRVIVRAPSALHGQDGVLWWRAGRSRGGEIIRLSDRFAWKLGRARYARARLVVPRFVSAEGQGYTRTVVRAEVGK